jgi:hypothetical protein
MHYSTPNATRAEAGKKLSAVTRPVSDQRQLMNKEDNMDISVLEPALFLRAV